MNDIARRLTAVLSAIEPHACDQDSGELAYAECRYCDRESPRDEEFRLADFGEQQRNVCHSDDCPVVQARALLLELEDLGTIDPPNTRIYRDRIGRCEKHQADICEVCPGAMFAEQLAPMEAIATLLHAQDNRATSFPVFIVEQKERIYGLSDDYAETFAWVFDNEEVSSDLAASLEAGYRSGCPRVDGYCRVGYADRWRFVTACLTEAGAKAYIALDGHNLREPRIFAASGYRNEEWQAVRTFLLGLNANV